jgi:hypothetical protein
MANRPEPFLTSGISLGIPTNNPLTIENIDNAIFLDSNGEMHFKDSWVPTQTDIFGNILQTLKLKDLWTKNNGVYSQDGKLYFKDSTVDRPYSLQEMVQSYKDITSKLINGGIYWLGRTSISNDECENIMININGDKNLTINDDGARIFLKDTNDQYNQFATGTKVFSIDNYLNNLTITDGGNKFTTVDGQLRWHDVPNHHILLPPIDMNKALALFSKLCIRLIKNDTPILFRLYDETANVVLDQISISNNSENPMEQQPTLTHYGQLPTYLEQLQQLKCQCQNNITDEEPPHIIKIQFYTNFEFNDSNDDLTYYSYLERRVIGIPNSLNVTPINNSSIDCIIWDTNKNDTIGRKTGSAVFNNQDLINITFDNNFTSSEYSINLSCNKNINVFWNNKKSSGFSIKSEKKFTGTVDWIATKLKNEGAA